MKRRIFGRSFFTVFLRLQIYESIEAIIWQSASYVYIFIIVFITECLLSHSLTMNFKLNCVIDIYDYLRRNSSLHFSLHFFYQLLSIFKA